MSSVSSSNSSDAGVASYYKNALRELDTAKEQENRRLKEHQESELQRLQDQYQVNLRKTEEEATRALEDSRRLSSEHLEREKDRYQASIDESREELYNARGKMGNSISEDLHKKELQAATSASELRHSKDMKDLDDTADSLKHRVQDAEYHRESQIKNLLEDHSDEIKQIRAETKNQILQNLEENRLKSAQVTDQAQDFDNQHRAEMRNVTEAHTHQVDQLGRQLEHQEKFSQARNGEILKEKDSYYTDIIQKKDQDTHDGKKEIRDAYERQLDQSKLQQKRLEERSNIDMESHVSKSSEEQARLLEAQAKNYTGAIHDLTQNYESQLDRLKESNESKLDKDGIPQLSIAAEAAVRKSLVKEYQNNFNAESDRNKNSAEQAQRKYRENYEKFLIEEGARESHANQENAKERADERFQFFNTVDEIQSQTTTRVRDQRQEHEKEVDSLTRQFGNMMEKQKRDYDYILSVAQNDANDKISSMRQELQMNSKLATRTLSERQNELTREYEKKLADQRSDYENRIDDLKSQNLRDLRDVDRKSKQETEMQLKAFEQRIIQAEAQSKERERSIIQSYQNELDRTRRSYELRSQKKS